MTESKTTEKNGKQSGNESEADSQQRAAGVNPDKSSHDAMATVKAGTGEGAGGGAKQKEGS